MNALFFAWYTGFILRAFQTIILILFVFFASEIRADVYKHVLEDGSILFSNSPLGTDCKVVIKEPMVPIGGKNKKDQTPDVSARVNLRVQNLSESSSPSASIISPESIHAAIDEKARQHNVDPKLVNAVIKAESNWNPSAVSRKGALGLMQLMPSTAALLGVNPLNPMENIDGGVRYLKCLIERFNGDLVLALAAYNAGPKLVEKKGMVPSIPETVAYVKRVLEYYNGGQGGILSINTKAIQKEIGKEFNRIKKVVLEDGSLLFTNSYSSYHSY